MDNDATNRMRGGVNMGCCHMGDWASCLCVCARRRAGEWICCQLCVHGKKNKLLTCRHYELMTSKGKNLISYMRHSCMLRKEQQNSNYGCCWFCAISGRLCIFTYFSVRAHVCVCFVLVACQGIPMQVLWLKIPFPGILSSTKAKIECFRDQSGLLCLPTETPSLCHLWPLPN